MFIPFEGRMPLVPDDIDPPTEMHLEPTSAEGETALWLDDFFWLDLIRRWPQRQLTIQYKPTCRGLLHPVVLHQLTMLRRVAPEWRLVGHCFVSDLADDTLISQAALSLYHEIYIRDCDRPGVTVDASAPSLEVILTRAAKVQAAARRTSPVITAEMDLEPDVLAAAALDDAIALETLEAIPVTA
jgi:hypothetical protein